MFTFGAGTIAVLMSKRLSGSEFQICEAATGKSRWWKVVCGLFVCTISVFRSIVLAVMV